jgi:hypothetical protein
MGRVSANGHETVEALGQAMTAGSFESRDIHVIQMEHIHNDGSKNKFTCYTLFQVSNGLDQGRNTKLSNVCGHSHKGEKKKLG